MFSSAHFLQTLYDMCCQQAAQFGPRKFVIDSVYGCFGLIHFMFRNSLLLRRPYKSKSFCVVSDDKKHGSSAVHAFTEHLIQEIRGVVPEVTK